jgi:hypothetical protein
MDETQIPHSLLGSREQNERDTLEAYLQTLEELPTLPRMVGQQTSHAVQLGSQIFYALQEELANRPDRLAMLRQSQPLLSTLLQLQRQTERNQQLIAKLDQEEPPARREVLPR